MAIQMKTFNEVMPAANNVIPIRGIPLSATNMPQIDVFWDDAWTGKCKGIVMFLAGGSGRGQIDTPTSPRPVTAITQGYMYINCLAPPQPYTRILRQNQFPVHDYYAWPLEMEGHLQTLYTSVIADSAILPFFDGTTPVVICGTSRGAGVVVQWSEMSRRTYSTYASKVVGVLSNAPAGSLDTGGLDGGTYRDGYAMVRSFYRFFQCVNHPLLATVGANDVTNMTRGAMERAWKSLTNTNMRFEVIGDSSYPHTWTYTYPAQFINLAISLFPGP